MGKCMNISIIILASIGIGMLVLSVATNNWKSASSGKIKTNYGLWYTCTSLGDTSNCRKMYSKIKDVPAEMAGIMAMMILAIIFQGLGMLVGTGGAMMKRKVGGGVAVLHLLAVVAAAAGLGMYVHYYGPSKYTNYDLDWSYFLGWVGAGAIFIELIFLIITLAS